MAATASATSTIKSATTNELRDSLQVQAPEDIVEYLNLLVYGDPGVGKTYLSGTAVLAKETAPVLVLDVEGGVTTLRRMPNIDVKPIRSISELEEAHEKLFRAGQAGNLYYKTVVIDSLTELADLDMKKIMAEAYSRNPDKVDKDVPSQREWGKSRAHTRTIVRAFRDLPCNVIYTASVATLQEEGQPTKYFPGFAGKLRTEVPGFMDIVGYLFSEIDPASGVITRKLQVQGSRRIVAKDRTSALGGIVEDPTIPMLWDLITKSQATS